MWIYNKNNQLINADKISCFNVKKGKDYYDDNAVLKSYHYIYADENKIIKTANRDEVYVEMENIKAYINTGKSLYEAGGIKFTEDENGNFID